MVEHLKYYASGADKLVPYRGIVVGMPNVGKSSIINSLRNIGMHKAKAARTGNHPGITRKIGGPIKIVEREGSSSIYVLDTPGVFVPFMPDADRMLKLALCGCVKDGLIPPTILADYLLFHMNKHSPLYYEKWSEPTNDIIALLDSYARKNGFIIKGGLPNTELAAVNLVHKWRTGQLGKFLLDDVLGDNGQLQTAMENEASSVSLNKLRKVEKEWRTQAGKQRIAEKGYHD
jgi:mitochondrial GTPase 1